MESSTRIYWIFCWNKGSAACAAGPFIRHTLMEGKWSCHLPLKGTGCSRKMVEKCSFILYENLILRFLLVCTLRFLVYSPRGNRFDEAENKFRTKNIGISIFLVRNLLTTASISLEKYFSYHQCFLAAFMLPIFFVDFPAYNNPIPPGTSHFPTAFQQTFP